MKRGLFGRIFLALAILGAATYYIIPGIVFFTPPGSQEIVEAPFVEKYFPDTRIHLGLDLLGGIHLTLGVEVEKAVETALAQLGQDVSQEANRQGMLMTRPKTLVNGVQEVVLTVPERKAAFEEFIAKEYNELQLSKAEAVGGNFLYHFSFTSEAKSRIEDMAISQAVNTIRNRIDQFGVAEPDIRRQHGNRIAVQLPGMESTERAVNIIGQTAHLEFRLVRGVATANMIAPVGTEIIELAEDLGSKSESLVVEKEAALTGEYIIDAKALPDQNGMYTVSMNFDRRGGRIFSRITKENAGKRLAIVLDGKVHSAPNIKEEISGGQASISGNFTLTTANDLALVLRAGSLPAPVTVLEERTVGPSLGQESINAGATAALAGFTFTVVFMVIYYGISGAIAGFMLVLDIILILAGMSLLGATMTLPGIAGVVLTLGMAIDANVLIFERIREELKQNVPVKEAVALGFSHAQRAIIDSNLTSIIATVILYELGSGPIRGFAVTLTLGIIASMFTAIFVSRIIFDLWIGNGNRKLSI